MKEKALKIWVYFVVATIVLAIMGLFILVVVQICQVKALKRKQTELQAKLNNLLESEQYYDDANKYVASNEFIESYAREALGLGKEDEENYN